MILLLNCQPGIGISDSDINSSYVFFVLHFVGGEGVVGVSGGSFWGFFALFFCGFLGGSLLEFCFVLLCLWFFVGFVWLGFFVGLRLWDGRKTGFLGNSFCNFVIQNTEENIFIRIYLTRSSKIYCYVILCDV